MTKCFIRLASGQIIRDLNEIKFLHLEHSKTANVENGSATYKVEMQVCTILEKYFTKRFKSKNAFQSWAGVYNINIPLFPTL